MKYQKTLATLAGLTFAGALSQAQIAIGENLTVSGFIDASYTDTNTDVVGSKNSTDVNIEEVEIDFAFSFDAVSAEIHLQTKSDGKLDLEQAFVSTDLGGITISAGRMVSLLGFEDDETTGLYQSSNAYDIDSIKANLKTYNNGIRGAYSQGDFSLSASITDNLYESARDRALYETGGNAQEVAVDVLLTYTGIENLSVSLGYADDGDVDENKLASSSNDRSIAQAINVFATYSLGQITLGGEYIDYEDGAGTSGDAYLLMGNYAVNDDLSLTVRHSEWDHTGGNNMEKTTVAANYSISDNLSSIVEYSTGELTGKGVDTITVKGIFTY